MQLCVSQADWGDAQLNDILLLKDAPLMNRYSELPLRDNL